MRVGVRSIQLLGSETVRHCRSQPSYRCRRDAGAINSRSYVLFRDLHANTKRICFSSSSRVENPTPSTPLSIPIDANSKKKVKKAPKPKVVVKEFDHFSVPSNSAFPESPVPIVLLGGEYLSRSVWSEWSRLLSQQGYSGICLSLADVIDPLVDDSIVTGVKEMPRDLYKLADNLQLIIESNKLVPPLLIAHSFSCLVAQKFLESYSLKGLIMIDPIPPRKTLEFIEKMAATHDEAYKDHFEKSSSSSSDEGFIAKVYTSDNSALLQSSNLSSSEGLQTKSCISVSTRNDIKSTINVLESISHLARENKKSINSSSIEGSCDEVNKDIEVILEPGSVPMFVCMSSENQDTIDSRIGLKNLLISCHGLAEEDFELVDMGKKYDEGHLVSRVIDWMNANNM